MEGWCLEVVIQETSDGVLVKPKKETKPEGKTLTIDDLVGLANSKGPR
jgi:hypothetical protein